MKRLSHSNGDRQGWVALAKRHLTGRARAEGVSGGFAVLALVGVVTTALVGAPASSRRSTEPLPGEGRWEKRQLTAEFWTEGACVADVDRDGHTDVLGGPYWYAGPDFRKRHLIYPAPQTFIAPGDSAAMAGFKGFLSGENGYAEVFLSYSMDVNRDGWMDYIAVGHPGKETWWYENPAGETGYWKKHLVLDKTDNESPQLLDITGDGLPELLCMNGGRLGYASPDPEDETRPWIFHAVTEDRGWQWNAHGLGCGDVNGDGRKDILTCINWWEQPEGGAGAGPWKKHDYAFSEAAAQMFATDVNGDGVNDVIASMHAHGFGIAWHERQETADGGEQWIPHVIAGTAAVEGETGVVFSQPHAVDLADINGDGLPDFVSGKRVWAHGPEGDEEPDAPAVLLWFELTRGEGGARYVAHAIDDDSGVGTQVMATDINGDARPDVVVGNKKGLFVFLQKEGKSAPSVEGAR